MFRNPLAMLVEFYCYFYDSLVLLIEGIAMCFNVKFEVFLIITKKNNEKVSLIVYLFIILFIIYTLYQAIG